MSKGPGLQGRKIRCPSCGAEIIVGGGKSSQRVKCPKCTAVIPTENADPEKGVDSVQELAQLKEQVARLEARIAALEAALVPVAPVAKIEPEDSTAAVAKLKWVRNVEEEVPPPQGISPMPDELHEKALVHNLKVLSGSQIMIRSAAGNEGARRLAERFKELFTKAEWRVNGVDEMQMTEHRHGLALAAGSLPPSREATRTYLAFTAAGFPLESRLDITLQTDETMLIVA